MVLDETKFQETARESLRSLIAPGDTIYTILRHTSSSRMTRWISLVIIDPTLHRPREITYLAAPLLGMKYPDANHDGLKVGGCGMDMGFHLVYSLGRAMFPDSFYCVGERCPANDHFNGDRDYTPHLHSDGGYAFWHAWL